MSQPRNYGIKTRSSSTSITTGMDTIHEESFVEDQATNTNETPLLQPLQQAANPGAGTQSSTGTSAASTTSADGQLQPSLDGPHGSQHISIPQYWNVNTMTAHQWWMIFIQFCSLYQMK